MSHRITLLLEYLPWALKHGAAWALLLLAAAGAGDLALRKLRFHSGLERLVFTLATGLGIYGLGLFSLGLAGLLYRQLIWGLTLAGASLSLWRIFRAGKKPWDAARRSWMETGRWERRFIAAMTTLSLVYGAALLLVAVYPPLHWDAIASHLVLAREFLAGHRVIPMRSLPHPILPALNHLLFSWAMTLMDDILAQMIEFTFMLLAALGLIAWGQRSERPLLGIAAAALWLAHPLVLWLGGSGYIDVGLASFCFLGVYAMRVFWDKRDAGWWTLGMTLFAMAAGVKLPGLFFVAMGAGLGFWVWIRSGAWMRSALWDRIGLSAQPPGGMSGQALLRGWGVALIVTLPWYAFVAFHTGNPFYPMFPQFSRAGWGPSNTAEDMNKYMSFGGTPKTVWNFLQAPIHLITRASAFIPDNQRGLVPVIALLPLAWLIALWHRSTRFWAVWLLAYTAFWYYTASFMRYWLPVLPLVGLALYEGLQWALDRVTKSKFAHQAVWVVIALAAMGYGLRTVRADFQIKGRPPVTPAERQAFLNGLCDGYIGIDYINRNAQPDDTIYLVNGNYLAYYAQPRSLGSSGRLAIDPTTATLVWPRDAWMVGQIEKKKPTWVALRHEGMGLPKDLPFEQPGGRTYELVKLGVGAYVFHRTPLPAALEADAAAARRDQSEPCPAGANSKFEGFVDAADCGAVSGWVWDTARPDCVVNVDIYDGQTLLATVTANRSRRDLAEVGKGNGNHAFTWPFPARLKDGRKREIHVRASGADYALPGGLRALTCSPRP